MTLRYDESYQPGNTFPKLPSPINSWLITGDLVIIVDWWRLHLFTHKHRVIIATSTAKQKAAINIKYHILKRAVRKEYF